MTTDAERTRIGEQVLQDRLALGLSKEHASREAGISSITWTRIERGQSVRPDRLGIVQNYLRRQLADAEGLDIQRVRLVDATTDQLQAELLRRLAGAHAR